MVAEDMLGDDWDEWNGQDENEQEGEILTSDEIEGIKDEIKELQRLYDLANSISSNKKGGLPLIGTPYRLSEDGRVGSQPQSIDIYGKYPYPALSETAFRGELVIWAR